MAQRYKSALLFGPPGAGKGTQGKLIGCIPGFFHHSSGDVFRNLDPGSRAGSIFSEYSHRGELVPDRVTIDVWREDIDRRHETAAFDPEQDLLLLDGIPRNHNQAVLMDEQIEVLKIVHLHCSNEDAFIDRLRKRALKENRVDDAEESVIRRRFEVYRQETHSTLHHYPADLVTQIEAVGSHAQVLLSILEVLVPVRENAFGASRAAV